MKSIECVIKRVLGRGVGGGIGAAVKRVRRSFFCRQRGAGGGGDGGCDRGMWTDTQSTWTTVGMK